MSEACDLCGDRLFSPYARDMYRLGEASLDLVRCNSCGLVQVRPLPTPAQIESLYGDDYFEKDYDSCLSEDSYFDSFPRLVERYGALLDAIERLETGRALFEVGAAGGYFLKLARERGFRVRGIEITRAGARHAREELGLDVERASFPDPDFTSEPSDVVYMGHVLEHLRSPRAGIQAAARLLRPGGLLVVEVPTYVDSPYFRGLRLGLPALRALGLDSRGLLRALKFPAPGETMEPFHLYEFRRRTLTRLLQGEGFRVLGTESRVPKPDGVAGATDPAHRAMDLALTGLDAAARLLGLPGGNVSVYARREDGAS